MHSSCFIRVLILLVSATTGCQRDKSTSARADSPIVGTWSGTYQNPESSKSQAASNMSFEYKFTADGQYHMGKRKVWVHGTYQFSDDKTFTLAIQGVPVGPYKIKELTQDRLVYERELSNNRVQVTELRRVAE